MAAKDAIKESRIEVRVGRGLAEVQEAAARIRRRAHELAAERGFAGVHALDDWLRAENELFYVPASELREAETEYSLHVLIPVRALETIAVNIEPRSVAVWGGAPAGETDNRELFCQHTLPHPVVVEMATAFFDSGELTVTLPKRSELSIGDAGRPAAA
ncbi:MAG: Hsp20/alpha crystallin family protein [Bryobacterales bacterium]|jgi:HSP20 family molecular chaperone IbpA|nr:Hsp20/alpha crystallin family protein [Bryobacterales bacterium]